MENFNELENLYYFLCVITKVRYYKKRDKLY